MINLKPHIIVRTFSRLLTNCPNKNHLSKDNTLNKKYSVRTMASANKIPLVDIDPSGVFKYILLNVYDKQKDPSKPQMVILRGYKRCDYHSDIYDEVQTKLTPLDCEPLGGGRISHDPDNKKIHIYGYSQGYGKADHEVAAKLVKDAYPGYTISISDEGY